MIGLDTNVLVRYLAQDDAKQAAIATRFIEQELSAAQPGFISLVVLVELCWVLKRLYGATESELEATVEDLLAAAQFQVERRETVQAAVMLVRAQKPGMAGFTDALTSQIAQAHGCDRTVSFGRTAVRSAAMVVLT